MRRHHIAYLHASFGQHQDPLPGRKQVQTHRNHQEHLRNGRAQKLLLGILRPGHGLHTSPRYLLFYLREGKITVKMLRLRKQLPICDRWCTRFTLSWFNHDSNGSCQAKASTLSNRKQLDIDSSTYKKNVQNLRNHIFLSKFLHQLFHECTFQLHHRTHEWKIKNSLQG